MKISTTLLQQLHITNGILHTYYDIAVKQLQCCINRVSETAAAQGHQRQFLADSLTRLVSQQDDMKHYHDSSWLGSGSHVVRIKTRQRSNNRMFNMGLPKELLARYAVAEWYEAGLCDREVAGSTPARGCCVPTPTQRAIPPGSVNE